MGDVTHVFILWSTYKYLVLTLFYKDNLVRDNLISKIGTTINLWTKF